MQEFKKGQRVKVEYEGVVDWFDGEALQLSRDDSRKVSRLVRVDTFNTKVTLLDPADWPPQVGDIWEAEGKEYYGRECRTAMEPGVYVGAIHAAGRDYMPGQLDGFKALNPVLVRRRGQ